MTKNMLITALKPLVTGIFPVLIGEDDKKVIIWLSNYHLRRYGEAQKIAKENNYRLEMKFNGEIWLVDSNNTDNRELLYLACDKTKEAITKICEDDLKEF